MFASISVLLFVCFDFVLMKEGRFSQRSCVFNFLFNANSFDYVMSVSRVKSQFVVCDKGMCLRSARVYVYVEAKDLRVFVLKSVKCVCMCWRLHASLCVSAHTLLQCTLCVTV